MTGRALGLAVTWVVAAAASCSPPPGSASPPDATGYVVRRVGDDGTSRDIRRIDGAVRHQFDAAVTNDTVPDVVVATGYESGSDQGKLFVLRADGSVALEHAFPYETPFADRETPGRRIRHVMTSGTGQALAFRHDGRRFLLAAATGRAAPSVLSLFEFDDDGSAAELLRFWNFGTIRFLFAEGDRFGFQGVNNALPTAPEEPYATVVATFRVPAAGSRRAEEDGVSPIRQGTRGGRGFETYAHLPAIRSWNCDALGPARLAGARVTLRDTVGLRFTLDVVRGVAEVTADPDRMKAITPAPDLIETLTPFTVGYAPER